MSSSAENRAFSKIGFLRLDPDTDEYEGCVFSNCDFRGGDFSGFAFRDCRFENCDLTAIKLRDVTLDDVEFLECKLLGAPLESCNGFLLSVGFKDCLLELADFRKMKLKKTRFENCELKEADFTWTDLSSSEFDRCGLSGTRFEGTNLEWADFRTSSGYVINPDANKVKGAKFSADGLAGLLTKYAIKVY